MAASDQLRLRCTPYTRERMSSPLWMRRRQRRATNGTTVNKNHSRFENFSGMQKVWCFAPTSCRCSENMKPKYTPLYKIRTFNEMEPPQTNTVFSTKGEMFPFTFLQDACDCYAHLIPAATPTSWQSNWHLQTIRKALIISTLTNGSIALQTFL